MKNRLLCYARLLRTKLEEEGCKFIKMNATLENNLVMEFNRNNVDHGTIDRVMMSIKPRYRLEVGKDIIKILLYEE